MLKKFGRAVAYVLVGYLTLGADDCDDSEAGKQSRQRLETTESLLKKQPAPVVGFSVDRQLLSERLTRFNDPNKMTYLYVILPDGTWLQVTIVGKLASTSKRLNRPEEWVNAPGGGYNVGPAPDEMGTWGSSEPAKVGMTTLGSLLEIGGFLAYVYSETPLTFKNLNKPVIELTVEVTAEEKAELAKKLAAFKKGVGK